MIRDVEVWLWGTRIGFLRETDASRAAVFEYDRDFIGSGIQVAPFMMPLSGALYSFPELPDNSFHGVPGMVADSLPDRFGNAVIDRWLASLNRTPGSFSSLDRLCYTGKRGMGALEYQPATGPEVSGDSIDITEMTRFAESILSGREDLSVREDDLTMARLMEIGTSAGGARAKAVIAWNEATGEVRSGQVDAGEGFRYYLLKFGGVGSNGDHGAGDKKQYTQIEHAYYKMALDLGVQMMESRLFEKDGITHFLTERYDRRPEGKVHSQTLGALIHADYNSPGTCSYELYADYAKKLGIGKSGIEQIFRRMVFAVAGANCDDHVKNFSFLMDKGGKWSLAPAYDITFAYVPGNRWLSDHQMTIAGKTNDITVQDLITCGRTMGLGTAFCRSVVDKTIEITGKWMQYAEDDSIDEERASEINAILVLLKEEMKG
ncbi:MAG: type II toxin-antitoxin system HipA family toxin [Lachnospiraceae bacterium]|nr:type II toxin-antitoxin system HipA family toxin [Lachnospiraceae bacterium]